MCPAGLSKYPTVEFIYPMVIFKLICSKGMGELQTRLPAITIKAKAFDLAKQAKKFGQ
jgi:hypothetical protein